MPFHFHFVLDFFVTSFPILSPRIHCPQREEERRDAEDDPLVFADVLEKKYKMFDAQNDASYHQMDPYVDILQPSWFYMRRATATLERYYSLLLFAAYVREQAEHRF